MSSVVPALLQLAALFVLLALTVPPLARYLAHVYSAPRHLAPERLVYRAVGVDPDADQHWRSYLTSVLGFSLVGVLALYAFGRLQQHLPLSLAMEALPADGAFNTAVSFVTNTNWQWYSGEAALGHLMQMTGLTVQNFVSAAVGMAVAVALARGLARSGAQGRVGNFWVDLVRGVLRVLLPISVLGALVLVALGVVQNFDAPQVVGDARRRQPDPHRRAGGQPGGHQGARHQRWRVLQRQLVPPLREPEPVEQPPRGLPHPAHPARDGAHLRSARRRPSPGPRGPGGHVDPARGLDRPPHLGRDGRTGRRTHRGGWRHGGQGGPLRRGRVGAVRGRHDGHVDGSGELHARLAHRPRRAGDALQHAARRDRAGRGRVRALRDADARRRDRLPVRPDGRAHARVARQEDRTARDGPRRALRPRHPRGRPRRHGPGDQHRRPGWPVSRRAARTASRRCCTP